MITLHERVEFVLAGNIADGSLPPAQVPSEGGLVERFKVSRTTVRRAIQNLVERGFVEVTRGKGTFVTQPRITRDARRLAQTVKSQVLYEACRNAFSVIALGLILLLSIKWSASLERDESRLGVRPS